MRARQPDQQGHVDSRGLPVGYEMFGDGDPTILLMPTWSIVHSRFWKFQVPYLSRHYRVISYDGPGNGRTERTSDPRRYTVSAHVDDAVAVLERCGVARAFVFGVSRGGAYAAGLAAAHPDRVNGLVLAAPSIGMVEQAPERAGIAESFWRPYPDRPRGWAKYNRDYWYDHYEDFVSFFMNEIFSEAHSTKAWDDSVGWALETGPEVLEAEARQPSVLTESEILDAVKCPILLVHGTDDGVIPHRVSEVISQRTGARLHSMSGSGHLPNVRDPVKFNLLARNFVELHRS